MIRASAVPGDACLGRSGLMWLRVGDSPEGSLVTEWAILSMMPAPCGCIPGTPHKAHQVCRHCSPLNFPKSQSFLPPENISFQALQARFGHRIQHL